MRTTVFARTSRSKIENAAPGRAAGLDFETTSAVRCPLFSPGAGGDAEDSFLWVWIAVEGGRIAVLEGSSRWRPPIREREPKSFSANPHKRAPAVRDDWLAAGSGVSAR